MGASVKVEHNLWAARSSLSTRGPAWFCLSPQELIDCKSRQHRTEEIKQRNRTESVCVKFSFMRLQKFYTGIRSRRWSRCVLRCWRLQWNQSDRYEIRRIFVPLSADEAAGCGLERYEHRPPDVGSQLTSECWCAAPVTLCCATGLIKRLLGSIQGLFNKVCCAFLLKLQ